MQILRAGRTGLSTAARGRLRSSDPSRRATARKAASWLAPGLNIQGFSPRGWSRPRRGLAKDIQSIGRMLRQTAKPARAGPSPREGAIETSRTIEVGDLRGGSLQPARAMSRHRPVRWACGDECWVAGMTVGLSQSGNGVPIPFARQSTVRPKHMRQIGREVFLPLRCKLFYFNILS